MGCAKQHTPGMPPASALRVGNTQKIVGIGVADNKAPADSKRVLVVVNTGSPDSIEIARYYASKRKIPATNIFPVDISAVEEVSASEFNYAVKYPLQDLLRKRTDIDFVVLTKGMPIRMTHTNGYGTDAAIAAMYLPNAPIPEVLAPETKNKEQAIEGARNPYLNAVERFSRKKYNMVLVTRLDGYTIADAKKLVDNSVNAKPESGPFFFDLAGNRNTGGYGGMQQTLVAAYDVIKRKGFQAVIDRSEKFIDPGTPVAGYASWGSNDGAFDLDTYRKIRFKPGALCETFVSTSGRTFRPATGGQSLIADLISQGVTGIKGYVSEPYTFALAQPQIIFDRYTAGWNLAESFYAASPVIKWKDVVVGDPLCRPYGR